MNTEIFIAKRIIFNKTKSGSFSRPIINIATWGIATGIIVMILSVAIIVGFKSEISNKVIGFGSHIRIKNFDTNNSFEDIPISKKQDFYPGIKSQIKGVKHIQIYATKLGLVKTKETNEEVLIKGVGSDFSWDFFKRNIVSGKAFKVDDSLKTDNIVISKYLADRTNLNVGDKMRVFFLVNNTSRPRVFIISGIYETGLLELDKIYAIADIKHIQEVNNWEKDMVGGFEVLIDDYDKIDEMEISVFDLVGYKIYEDGSKLDVNSIKKIRPEIFDWLKLQDINVWIILILMIIVAIFNMTSALLIIILERTNMIGTLKALGTSNWGIRKIFVYNAMYLIGKGMFWGNLIGIGLCLIQQHFHIITLSQESYYVSTVPIYFNWLYIVLLNIGTLVVCSLAMLIPSYIVTNISPVKAIRFN